MQRKQQAKQANKQLFSFPKEQVQTIGSLQENALVSVSQKAKNASQSLSTLDISILESTIGNYRVGKLIQQEREDPNISSSIQHAPGSQTNSSQLMQVLSTTPHQSVQRQYFLNYHNSSSDTNFPDWNDIEEQLHGPVETNWDVPANTSATDLAPGWNERPNFPNGYDAHERTAELDQGKTTIQNDWLTLSQSWNTVATLANRYNIRAMLPDGIVTEINGQPVPEPSKELRSPDTERAKPIGGYQIENIFTGTNSLDLNTPFDPNRLRGGDRTLYDEKATTAVTARNNRTAKEIAVENKFIEVSSALSRVRQAQIHVRNTEAGEKRVDEKAESDALTRSQKEIETVINASEAILQAGVKRTAEAGVTAITKSIGALSSVYYSEKLGQVEQRLAELDRVIARGQTSLAMEDVIQARNNVRLSFNAVRIANTELDTAVQQEQVAFTQISQTVEQLARKQGFNQENAKIVATAAGAIPIIDETIGKLTEIEAAIHIPEYSKASGVGATLITNLSPFVNHLSILKGYQLHLQNLKQNWIARRNAAEKGVGLPSQTSPPDMK